jgi:hypothetical protein
MTVKRNRQQLVSVIWPTKSQMAKRGCKPYVEYRVTSTDVLWRTHFAWPYKYAHLRPNEIYVKTGNDHQVILPIGDERIPLQITHRVVIAPAPVQVPDEEFVEA